MNQSKKYYREIRFREVKCCGNCKHLGDKINTSFLYCAMHDNPVKKMNICKFWNKGIIPISKSNK